MAAGPMVHYLKANQRLRGRASYTGIHSDDSQGAQHSELDVLDVCRVELTGTAAAEWGQTAFESLIELKTGRTHQVLCLPRTLRLTSIMATAVS